MTIWLLLVYWFFSRHTISLPTILATSGCNAWTLSHIPLLPEWTLKNVAFFSTQREKITKSSTLIGGGWGEKTTCLMSQRFCLGLVISLVFSLLAVKEFGWFCCFAVVMMFFFYRNDKKPGGELLISDYCSSAKELSETMKAYIAKRHYHLLTPADYGKILSCIELTISFLIVQVQKICILPPQKGLEFPGGWGVLSDQKI